MNITEERIVIVPNTECGRAYIDKVCEAYRLSGTAYSREDTTTGITLKTLSFVNVSTKYNKMADSLKEYCKTFTDCSGCEFYLDGCTIYGVPSEWEVNGCLLCPLSQTDNESVFFNCYCKPLGRHISTENARKVQDDCPLGRSTE